MERLGIFGGDAADAGIGGMRREERTTASPEAAPAQKQNEASAAGPIKKK